MSQTHKRVQLLIKFIEDSGLELDCLVDKHDGRVSAKARAHDGRTRVFSLSNSSTQDPRGDLNERAAIRRWANEVGQPSQLAIKLKEKLPELKRVVALEPKTVEQAAIMDAFDKLPREIEQNMTPTEEFVEQAARAIPKIKLTITTRKQRMSAEEKAVIAAKPKIRRLTMAENYKVIEWLKTIDTTQFQQTSQVANALNQLDVVPVQVPASSIKDAMDVLGLKLKDRRATANSRNDGHKSDVLAEELKRIADSLGFELSDKFKETWP